MLDDCAKFKDSRAKKHKFYLYKFLETVIKIVFTVYGNLEPFKVMWPVYVADQKIFSSFKKYIVRVLGIKTIMKIVITLKNCIFLDNLCFQEVNIESTLMSNWHVLTEQRTHCSHTSFHQRQIILWHCSIWAGSVPGQRMSLNQSSAWTSACINARVSWC